MRRLIFGLALATVAAIRADAADEFARKDINGVPAETAVSETTGEIRRLKATNDGYQVVKSTFPAGFTMPISGTVTANAGSGIYNTSGSSVSVSNVGGDNLRVVFPLPQDVMCINGVGAAAVNVQDGGNSLTIDGSVSALQSGSWNIGLLTGTNNVGTVSGSSVSVTNADGTSLVVADGGSSLTVDSPQLPAALILGRMDVNVGNVPAVSQSGAWNVGLLSGANNVGTVSGSSVSVTNAAGTTLAVDDGGSSITVDGGVTATQGPAGAAAWLVTGTGAAFTESIAARCVNAAGTGFESCGGSITVDPYVHIVSTFSAGDPGHVLVDNAGGASAVNVQDGGNSLTIDGSVSATLLAGSANVGTVSGSSVAVANVDGTKLAVEDGGGSLTVDGAVTANAGSGTFATDPVDEAGRKLGQVFLRNPGDSVNMGDATNPVRTDPTGSTAQPVSGTLTADQGSAGAAPWLVKGSGAGFADSLSVRCVNTAGTGFEACGGAGGPAVQEVSIVSTFSATNPGHVLVDNGAGVAAVNIQDGGNSVTVDGTVTANAGSGTFATNVSQVGGSATDVNTGTAGAGTQRVVVASNQPALPVSQSGAWTVDLGAGASQVGTVSGSSVSVANVAGTSLAVNDNGGSLTVDAVNLDVRDLSSASDSVAAAQSGAWTMTANAGTGNFQTNVAQVAGTAVSVNAGAADAGTQRVVLASDQAAVALNGGAMSLAPEASTGTCASGSASVALVANASAGTTMFCNEGADPVRIGPASVTSSVGLRVMGDTCAALDGPVKAWQAALYCTSTTGSGMAFSTLQGR